MSKWPLTKIGKLLTPRQTAPDPEKIASGEFSIVSKISFASGQIELRDHAKTNTNMITIMPGDLVVSGINAGKGAIAIYEKENKNPATATIHYSSYEVNSELTDIEYLWYFFRSEVFREILRLGLPNGIKTELRPNKFITLEIPLPPLSEQKRIVKKIKEIEEKVKFVKLNRIRSIEYQSSFYETGLSKLFKKFNFKYEIFSEVVDFRRGPFGGSLRKEIFVESGPKVYEQKNAIYNDFTLGKYFITEEKYKEMGMFAIKPGDLIVSCSGTIGKIAIVPDYALRGIINQALLKITPNREKILASFLELILENPDFGDQIFVKVRGSAMKNIGALKYIKKIKIPLPDIKTQQEIISIASKLKEFLSVLNKETTKNKRIISALMPSVLARAFNGEL